MDNVLKASFPLIPYRMEYISGAWDELTSRGMGPTVTLVNINEFDSVRVFLFQLNREMEKRFRECPLLRENKVRVSFHSELEFPDLGNPGITTRNSQNLAIRIDILFFQG